jgi:hypothetical protein
MSAESGRGATDVNKKEPPLISAALLRILFAKNRGESDEK